MRDELLNETPFIGLVHVWVEIVSWVEDRSRERPRSALGYATPRRSPPNWISNSLLRYALRAPAKSPIASTALMRNNPAPLHSQLEEGWGSGRNHNERSGMKLSDRARKLITAVICLIFPGRVLAYLLALIGHSVSPRAKVGFSLLFTDRLMLDETSRIGHFNIIVIRRLVLRQNARIGSLNAIRGPLSLWLDKDASIGNRNVVARARKGVTYGPAVLRLGELTKITAGHKIDCAASIHFGSFSILAGAGSQLWTHGYVHDETGPGRYRVDGEIHVGDNVYLGSRVIVTGGVAIANTIIVGAGVTVARSLTDPGMYVSAPTRRLPRPDAPSTREDMIHVKYRGQLEAVFRKRK